MTLIPTLWKCLLCGYKVTGLKPVTMLQGYTLKKDSPCHQVLRNLLLTSSPHSNSHISTITGDGSSHHFCGCLLIGLYLPSDLHTNKLIGVNLSFLKIIHTSSVSAVPFHICTGQPKSFSVA